MRHSWIAVLRIALLVSAACALLVACASAPKTATPAPSRLPLSKIKLPPGFVISVYVDNLVKPRGMTLGKDGTLFVGSYGAGNLYAIEKGGARVHTIEGLKDPNGVAFRDGALYVAETTRIVRFDDIEARLTNPPSPHVICASLPKQRIHGLRTIRFGPDGMLYVPIGSRCNACADDPEKFAVLAQIDAKTAEAQPVVVARGVRDTQGFDWHPQTGELWFTDNGRDGLGNDAPADEVNRLTQARQHFGFPHCHGAATTDPEFAKGRACAEFVAPALELPAHAAPLGMVFYTGTQFPAEYRNRIFLTEHGSSDREPKIGSRVSMLTLGADASVKYEPFAEGWLENNEPWGRPVDVIVAADGALLVSDDKAGAIYRIEYKR